MFTGGFRRTIVVVRAAFHPFSLFAGIPVRVCMRLVVLFCAVCCFGPYAKLGLSVSIFFLLAFVAGCLHSVLRRETLAREMQCTRTLGSTLRFCRDEGRGRGLCEPR